MEYDGWLNFTRDEWFDYWTSFRSTRAAPLSDPSPASTFSFAPDGACEDGTTTLPAAGDGQAGAAHTEEADTWQEEEQYPAEDDSDPKLYVSWGQEPWVPAEITEWLDTFDPQPKDEGRASSGTFTETPRGGDTAPSTLPPASGFTESATDQGGSSFAVRPGCRSSRGTAGC